jgi:plastocyanin domain-containing protein
MSKNTLIAVSVLLGLGIVWVLVSGNNSDSQNKTADTNVNTVAQQGNQQRIKILARGGYTPSQINAVANKDTVLEFETKGTYDCSSSISIPALNYRTNLPPTGSTEVKISAAQAKDSIEILCGMGMYRATVNFES